MPYRNAWVAHVNSRNQTIFEVTAALLAIVLIGGSMLIEVILVVREGRVTELPNWLAEMDGGIIGFYFARGAAQSISSALGNGHKETDERIAANREVIMETKRTQDEILKQQAKQAQSPTQRRF